MSSTVAGSTLIVAALFFLAGCSGGVSSPPEPSTSASTPGLASTEECPAEMGERDSAPELKGTASDDTSLYGLVITDQWPLRASSDVVKVVWRMTGDGDLRVGIDDPNGEPRELAWGPEAHSGSSYDRPGQEWGTGFIVEVPGCWHLNLTRSGHGSSDVWLTVMP